MEEIKEKIERIFETGGNQTEILDGIYSLFEAGPAPSFVGDRPFCGRELYRFIADNFQAYDYRHYPKAFPGGLWLAKGFRESRYLDDWQVSRSIGFTARAREPCFD